jgi:hypothetical protein
MIWKWGRQPESMRSGLSRELYLSLLRLHIDDGGKGPTMETGRVEMKRESEVEHQENTENVG